MIDAVRRVTHIAPADPDGKIVGYDVVQEGVVLSNSAGKGKGATNATYASTTEVYPDSKVSPVTGVQCNQAQMAAIVAGLEYILANVIATRKTTTTRKKTATTKTAATKKTTAKKLTTKKIATKKTTT